MPESSPGDSTAWLLQLDDRFQAAVGEREMIHLIELPLLLEVPKAPRHCRQVLVWNEEILPAMDLAAWLAGRPVQRVHRLAGVFAYQEHPQAAPSYGALLLAALPARLRVSDEQACDLPEQPAGWRQLAVSCFKEGERPVPILDLPFIFSDALLKM